MPIWWKYKQWREQFPLDVYAKANITIKPVKEGQIPDLTLCLCPDWTGAKNSRCPKKGERYKSGLEKATAKGKPVLDLQVIRRCVRVRIYLTSNLFRALRDECT